MTDAEIRAQSLYRMAKEFGCVKELRDLLNGKGAKGGGSGGGGTPDVWPLEDGTGYYINTGEPMYG